MMKLNLELKNDEFIFSYEVGTSKGQSKCPMHTDFLIAFVNVLQYCHKVCLREGEDRWESYKKKMWLEEINEDKNK